MEQIRRIMRPTDVPDTGKQVLTLKFGGSKLSIPLDNMEPISPPEFESDS